MRNCTTYILHTYPSPILDVMLPESVWEEQVENVRIKARNLRTPPNPYPLGSGTYRKDKDRGVSKVFYTMTSGDKLTNKFCYC